MDSFANRVVLITGAGSGIGRQLALLLATEGATIAALDLHPEGLASLSGELAGKRIATATGDVTDRAGLYAAIAELERQLGPTDVLFANAGIGRETAADPYNAEGIELQIRVNLIGVSNSIGAVLPSMIRRKSGHLVAISSLASFRGLPKMAGYCASKAGVNSLLERLRIEVEPHGIATTTICPGWIRTPLTKNIDVPQPYLMELDFAARQIVEVVRRRRVFFAFPGASARRMRLMHLLPAGMSDWIVRRMIAMYGMKKVKTDGAGPG